MRGYGGLHFTSSYGGVYTFDPRCASCKGTGTKQTDGGIDITCEDCKGTGIRPLVQYYPPWWAWTLVICSIVVGLLFVIYGTGSVYK